MQSFLYRLLVLSSLHGRRDTFRKSKRNHSGRQKLRADTPDALLTALHTELAVVPTMCILARSEDGEPRAHHVKHAEIAFAMFLEIAKRVEPALHVLADFERARQDALMLDARAFSKMHRQRLPA